MRLSVIVPVLDEEGTLAATLGHLARHRPDEIVVVDGGSRDRTVAVAAPFVDRVLTAPRGRARQMNAGAAAAGGDVLLFLHADTLLPDGYREVVRQALSDESQVWGRFDVGFEPSPPLVWLVGFLMNRRSRLTGICTGDQAIFVRRAAFEQLGGYADIAIMEDIELTTRLKRLALPVCLRQRVTTSSRRWRRGGALRTILLMWTMRLLYFLGVSPATLRRWYDDVR